MPHLVFVFHFLRDEKSKTFCYQAFTLFFYIPIILTLLKDFSSFVLLNKILLLPDIMSIGFYPDTRKENNNNNNNNIIK